jgi:trimeric autotransporter adhesin
VAVGSDALGANTTGPQNVAIGYQAGLKLTTADDSTFIGYLSGYENTIGIENTYVGALSGYNNATGNYNTAVGWYALFGSSGSNQSQNTALGYAAGDNITTGTNNIVLGYNADASSATVSNEITLGNTAITTLRCQVTTITSLSDARDKTDIQPLNAGLKFVEALKPVAFTWDMRDGGKVGEADTGFIAQDLQAAQADTGVSIPGLVYDINPDKLEAGYGKLIPVLVKAIQELSAEVESLKTKLNGA